MGIVRQSWWIRAVLIFAAALITLPPLRRARSAESLDRDAITWPPIPARAGIRRPEILPSGHLDNFEFGWARLLDMTGRRLDVFGGLLGSGTLNTFAFEVAGSSYVCRAGGIS